jgi:UDP-N-acetylglucosamine:LPS N-acetylglucosamine transferase
MAPASYAPEMYRKLAAAIIRPGAGTVTDCVSRAVWMVWPEADDHQEIRHNASALVSHDIGAIAPTASSAIEMVTAFASNPARTRRMRDVCRAMKFGAAARIAAVLMNRD